MTLDELRDEFDWMFEFQSRMAERIRDDEDVHNLVDYVTKLEAENAKLRKLVKEAHLCMVNEGCCEDCYATYGECPIEMGMRELGIEAPD